MFMHPPVQKNEPLLQGDFSFWEEAAFPNGGAFIALWAAPPSIEQNKLETITFVCL